MLFPNNYAHWEVFFMKLIQCNSLSTDELTLIKKRLEGLLINKGIKITHAKVLKELSAAGAKTIEGHVYFPKDLIQDALACVPKRFTLAGIEPEYDLEFPHPQGLFYTRTSTGAMNYYDEHDQYHQIQMQEVVEWTKLTNFLKGIDFTALPSTTTKEVPGEAIDIHTLRTVLEHSKKHVWVQPYEAENVKYLIELAQKRVGGADQLRKRPIISMITCSAPPFGFKDMDMEALYQSCLNGIPIQPCSLPAAGANSPVTFQGTALMAATEVMAQIIIAQILSPGLPVIATPHAVFDGYAHNMHCPITN
jgi:trimethylamine--corrinoid protein Co-methyltransferase